MSVTRSWRKPRPRPKRNSGAGATAEATRVLNSAHARDPKFYEFTRTLETYRSILDDRIDRWSSRQAPPCFAC